MAGGFSGATLDPQGEPKHNGCASFVRARDGAERLRRQFLSHPKKPLNCPTGRENKTSSPRPIDEHEECSSRRPGVMI